MTTNFINQVNNLCSRSMAKVAVLLVLSLIFFNGQIKFAYAACNVNVRWTQLGLTTVTTASRTGNYSAEATFTGCAQNGYKGYLIISASSLSSGSTKEVNLIPFSEHNDETVVITGDVSVTTVDEGHTIVAEAKVNNASGTMVSGTQKKANLSVRLQGPQPGDNPPPSSQDPNPTPGSTNTPPVNTQYKVGYVDYDAGYGFLQPLGKAKNVPDFIASILKLFFLGIAGWTIIFVLIGTFRMIMSRGNAEAIAAGRKTVTWAITGLVVALLSYSIVAILQTALGVVAQ